MTMIACTINQGFPICIADILISAVSRKDYFVVPTIKENIIPKMNTVSGLLPDELRQKIFIVKDNCCIVFAGKTSYAIAFLEDFRIFCNAVGVITAKHVQGFLTDDRMQEFEGHISFLISIVEKSNSGRICGLIGFGKRTQGETKTLGQVMAAGSGAKDFCDEADSLEILGFQPIKSYQTAVQLNNVIISSLLTKEWAEHKHVTELWGGGIEMVFFDGVKFRRLESVAYVLGEIGVFPTGVSRINSLSKIIYYRYVGEVLVILTLEGEKGKQDLNSGIWTIEIPNPTIQHYVVRPMDMKTAVSLNDIYEDKDFVCTQIALGMWATSLSDPKKPTIPSSPGDRVYLSGFFDKGEIIIEYQKDGGVFVSFALSIFDSAIANLRRSLSK